MKEHPILFSADMVRAILDRSKTQTRRIVKTRHPLDYLGPSGGQNDPENWGWSFDGRNGDGFAVLARGLKGQWPSDLVSIPCPYGEPGDLLWVRETWQAWVCVSSERDEWDLCDGMPSTMPDRYGPAHVEYRATSQSVGPWRPSIHMPRWASRIPLLNTAIRAERVQDITDDDALREGINPLAYEAYESPRMGFRELWERIHGPGSWDRNDWVWVVEFQRVDGASASTNKENCNE